MRKGAWSMLLSLLHHASSCAAGVDGSGSSTQEVGKGFLAPESSVCETLRNKGNGYVSMGAGKD